MPWSHAVVRFKVKMSCFSACCQHNCLESSAQSPMGHVAVSNEDYSSCTEIGLSNDCKWVREMWHCIFLGDVADGANSVRF